jgi:hypothetical protein
MPPEMQSLPLKMNEAGPLRPGFMEKGGKFIPDSTADSGYGETIVQFLPSGDFHTSLRNPPNA